MPSKPAAIIEAPEAPELEPSEASATESPVAPAPPVLDPVPEYDDRGSDDDEDEEDDAPSADAGGLDVVGLMSQFSDLMARRDEQIWARLEERLAGVIPPPATNGHVPNGDAEMSGLPGQHPTWMTMPQSSDFRVEQQPQKRAPRMVAFIPKEDPYNPRQKTFRTWINGREIRSKRGQVMILTMGHGISLAKAGHGNCVDIAAMQGSLGAAPPMDIPQQPDFARPPDWDGTPLTRGSSFAVGR